MNARSITGCWQSLQFWQRSAVGAMLLATFWLFWLPRQAVAADEHRIALVIGNTNYLTKPLANPVRDAALMATTLEQLGFEVIQRRDVKDREQFLSIAQDFLSRIRKDSVAFFYYAGHAVQFEGRNFLLPTGKQIRSEEEAESLAYDVGHLFTKLEGRQNQVNVIVLDACRDNPLPKTVRSVGQGLAVTASPSGSLIAYSTAPNQTAEDGGAAGNSLYTRALAEEMAVPGVQIESVFKRVAARVTKETRSRQRPWYHTSLTGDLVLNQDGKKVVLGASGGGESRARRSADGEDAWQAGRVPAPKWSVGDRWEYMSGIGSARQNARPVAEEVIVAERGQYQIRSTAPTYLVHLDEKRQVVRYQTNGLGERRHTFDQPMPFMPFPLPEEEAWSAQRTEHMDAGASQSSHAVSLTAQSKGWEQIEVAAGEFRALRVEYTLRTPGEQPIRVAYWYAPEVRNVVKEVRRMLEPGFRGGLTEYAFVKELVDYQIAK